MKRSLLLSLSLLLLLGLIPGCITVQIPATPAEQPSGTPSVIGTFSSNPSTINSGGTTTLMWNVTGANSVSIDNGIGQVSAVGARVISPSASTVYTISATNASGTVTRSAMTIVHPGPLPPAPGSSAVTSVIANTEPRNSTGCMNLYANITANGPCTVSYLWESLDGGGYSYTWTITFAASGTQKITLPVDMSALPSGNYQLHVVTPNDVVSNSTYYTTCQ